MFALTLLECYEDHRKTKIIMETEGRKCGIELGAIMWLTVADCGWL